MHPTVSTLGADEFHAQNDQDHRAGGPPRVIVEQPKNSSEANDVEKPNT